MTVAFVTTMFGFHDGSAWQSAYVGDVSFDRDPDSDRDWIDCVRVSHSGGTTECDEDDEVWAK